MGGGGTVLTVPLKYDAVAVFPRRHNRCPTRIRVKWLSEVEYLETARFDWCVMKQHEKDMPEHHASILFINKRCALCVCSAASTALQQKQFDKQKVRGSH